MNPHDLLKIQTALTAYDKRQAKGKRYNPYALPQYLEALRDADEEVSGGRPLGLALARYFTGSVLDAVKKAVGAP